jgi:hypothetical protein
MAVGALMWSCESEQNGYEVALPLIGPTEFDGTSCEGSGDVCSTDAECIDEDGFDDGPCTKTLTPFEPITYSFSLSPGNPSYTFPPVDTSRWVSPLTVLQNADSSPIVITSEGFSVTGGPVTLSVRPFSRLGLIIGQNADYVPVSPASCTFTLDDGSTADDYTSGISTCLRDWVKQNGVPVEFDVEVSSSAGAAAKSGIGLKQDGNYTVTGGDSWETDQKCEGQGSYEVLDAVGEGSDFFDALTCNALSFSGRGQSSEEIEVFGVAAVFDACGTWLSLGSVGSAIGDRINVGPGEFSVTVYESNDFEPSADDVPVTMLPSPRGFVESLLFAGSGECLLGGQPPSNPLTGEPAEGFALAAWEHCSEDEPDPPRTGNMEYTANGFCPVGQGSAGESGQ